MTLQDYQIAAGWNNSAGLTNIESITPTGATSDWLLSGILNGAYYYVQSIGSYSEQRVLTAGDITTQQGFESVQWRLSVARYEAYVDFYSDFVIDTNSKVTVRTPALTTTFANYNAVITMTQPRDLQRQYNRGGAWVLDGMIMLSLRGAAS